MVNVTNLSATPTVVGDNSSITNLEMSITGDTVSFDYTAVANSGIAQVGGYFNFSGAENDVTIEYDGEVIGAGYCLLSVTFGQGVDAVTFREPGKKTVQFKEGVMPFSLTFGQVNYAVNGLVKSSKVVFTFV